MVPAAVVESSVKDLAGRLAKDDILIDGGNSYYIDDMRRAAELAPKGIHYVDVGTSGGVWGLERGYCMMIGGHEAAVARLDPIFKTLAPGIGNIDRTPGREKLGGTSEQGYLHCGPSGAGHFVKMVHNGIEYGIMAAYAEGLNILKHSNVGKQTREVDAETTPLRNPEHLSIRLESGRRVRSLAARQRDRVLAVGPDRLGPGPGPAIGEIFGSGSDSGEGRWTILAAIEEGAPAPVLSTALYQRFTSRGEEEFADKLLSAMRFEFGGHLEKK